MAMKSRLNIDPSFSMSSMTDIVFLLLIFFLVTSTLVNPNALKLLLPKSTNQISTKAEVSVSIKHHQGNRAGNEYTYHINGNLRAIPFSAIEAALQEQLRGSNEPVISLHVDQSVPTGELVNVMNIAKRNNYKVLLATAPE